MRKAVLLALLVLLAPALATDWLNAKLDFSFADGYQFLHNDTLAVTVTVTLGNNVSNFTDYEYYMYTSNPAFTINGTYNGVQKDIYVNKTNASAFTTTAYTLKAEDNFTQIILNMDEELCAELWDTNSDNMTVNCTSIKTPLLSEIQANAVWVPPADLRVYAVGRTADSHNTSFLNTSYFLTYNGATCATLTTQREEYAQFNVTTLASCPSEQLKIYTNSSTPGYLNRLKNLNLYMVRNLTFTGNLYVIEEFGVERNYSEVPRIIGNTSMRIHGKILYDNGKSLGATPDTSKAEVWLTGDEMAAIKRSVNTANGEFTFDFEVPENESEYTLALNATGVHGLDADMAWEVKVNNTKVYVKTEEEMIEIQGKLAMAIDTSSSPLVTLLTTSAPGETTLNCTNQTVGGNVTEVCVNVTSSIEYGTILLHASEGEATPVSLTVTNENLFEVFGKATLHSANESMFEITPSVRDSTPASGERAYSFQVKARKYARPGRHNATIAFETFYGDIERDVEVIIDEAPWPARNATVRRYIDYGENSTVRLRVKNTKAIPITIKITEDIPKSVIPTLDGYYVTEQVTDANNVTTNVTIVNPNMTWFNFSEFPQVLVYDPRVQWTMELPPGGEYEVWYTVNQSVDPGAFAAPSTFVDTHGIVEELPPEERPPEPPEVIVPPEENGTQPVEEPPPVEPPKEEGYPAEMWAIFALLALSAITIVAAIVYWKKEHVIYDALQKLRNRFQKAPALPKAEPKKPAPLPAKPAPQKIEEVKKVEAPKKDEKKQAGTIETATGTQEADSMDTIGESHSD